MSWDIDITGPLPDPKEPIASICLSEGSLVLVTEKVGFKRLAYIKDREEAISALIAVITELDKGNEGIFNDDWCEYCDMQWSNGREMEENWSGWETILSRARGELNLPFKDKKTCWGNHKRTQLRSDAVRFMLYYKSGYDITYTW